MNRLLLPALGLLFSVCAHADPLADFQTRIRAEYVKPLALDLGGILGSDSAHTGKVIGFPGFWAGIVGAGQFRPDQNDRVLRDSNVKTFGLPLIEVGVGLPFKTDLVVHGVKSYGWTVYGAGVRYGVYQAGLIDAFLPSVSVAAFGDRINHPYFHVNHLGFDATATWSLPLIRPFILAGADVTTLKVTSAAIPSVDGVSATANGSRFSLGADVTPFPFLSLRGAYTLRHGMPGFDLGLGVRF
jgi:hypothetical protein